MDSDAMSATSDGVSRGMVEFHKRYPRTVVPMAAGDRYGDWVCGNLQQAAVRARAKLLRGTILHWTMRNVDSEDSRPGTAGDGGDSASNAGVDRVIQEALADIYAKVHTGVCSRSMLAALSLNSFVGVALLLVARTGTTPPSSHNHEGARCPRVHT